MSDLASLPTRLEANPRRTPEAYPADFLPVLSHAGADAALSRIRQWPAYVPTPLIDLAPLAGALGLARVLYKHEGPRFGLKSFKALGGAHAVQRIIEDRVFEKTGALPTTSDLLAKRHARLLDGLTVACATDGNHGRSVAWGAEMFGIGCTIFLHETVSRAREEAIARYGARIIRTEGNYDQSVRISAEMSEREGWTIVSDTSWPGYETIPRHVMQGYAVMVAEALDAMAGVRPTHVFIQGGVGGLAAAVTAQLWEQYGVDAPLVIVVEPDKAACLFESNRADRAVAVHGALDTIMAGLACGEPSVIAWPILSRGAGFFMEIADEAAEAAMRLLADGVIGTRIASGESGVAGLAGLLVAGQHPDWVRQIGLGPESTVLLFGSEGATDPDIYEKIVGRSAGSVERGA